MISRKFPKQWLPMHWYYELKVSDDHVMCWIKNVSIKIKIIKYMFQEEKHVD